MTRSCIAGCGKLLVLVLGTRLPRFCWDCANLRALEAPVRPWKR